MICGIFMLVVNMASRREADREMMMPLFLQNLKQFFPAWISNKPLNKRNIHERWNIESEILIQKHHGYKYEHCFLYNWNAITVRSHVKGYHFLMRIGLMLNVLVQYSECFINVIKTFGRRGTIKLIFETLKGPWLNADYMKKQLDKPLQRRLI